MIPQTISPEKYVQYFRPSADYIIVQRLLLNYDKIGSIHLPQEVSEGSMRFVTVGKVLAISDMKSSDPQIEYVKKKLRAQQGGFFKRRGDMYVGFSYHVVADLAIMPQFKLPEDVSLIMLHLLDITLIPHRLDDLLREHEAFEAQEVEKANKIQATIEEERARIIAEREASEDGEGRSDSQTA